MWRVLRVLLAIGGLLASKDNREKNGNGEKKTRARSIMPSLEKKRKGGCYWGGSDVNKEGERTFKSLAAGS